MIDLIILGILLLGLIIGLKRGFILQFLHLLGFIIAFIIAVTFYDDLASKLTMWIPYPSLPEGTSWAVFLDTLPLETAYYNAISFAILFFSMKIVLHIIATMLDFVANLPVLNSVNSVLGALLGFIEVYCVLFILLYIFALAPVNFIQTLIEQSSIATFMIEQTPLISKQIKDLWF